MKQIVKYFVLGVLLALPAIAIADGGGSGTGICSGPGSNAYPSCAPGCNRCNSYACCYAACGVVCTGSDLSNCNATCSVLCPS